jgi:glyoxylase-like metal-dependent hydrolase (beta-lactamase superfamily II)
VSSVSHIVLTHNHLDHILGAAAFDEAEIYCAPEVGVTMADDTDHLRADALRFGADADEVDRAIAALRVPEHQVSSAVLDLGDRTVTISRPGRGHIDHDLIAVVTGADTRVVFCGDLVEESGDPSVDADSDGGVASDIRSSGRGRGSRCAVRTGSWRCGGCDVHPAAA